MCEICGKGYAHKPKLKMHHKESHDGIRPHNCQICDAKFKRKNHLKTHFQTIHAYDDESSKPE